MAYRERLREMPTSEELATMYRSPHDHRLYGDGHSLRVHATIGVAKWLAASRNARTLADLSCGNAEIARAVSLMGMAIPVLGDFAPGFQLTGPIEETIEAIHPVDLFICSETVEHLDDPDAVLARIRTKARLLILTTPIGEGPGGNPEHIWGWSQEAVGEMLAAAGWTTLARADLQISSVGPIEGYNYMVWACC